MGFVWLHLAFGVLGFDVLQLYIFAGVVLCLVQLAVKCCIGVCILFFVIEMTDSFQEKKCLAEGIIV